MVLTNREDNAGSGEKILLVKTRNSGKFDNLFDSHYIQLNNNVSLFCLYYDHATGMQYCNQTITI